MTTSAWEPTACILCECNCGLEVELGGDGNRHLVRLRGDRRHPSSQGYTCEKAHRLDYYQHARDRVLSPQRRRADGTFESIDWDTAIREVSSRLAAVRDEFGGDTIFYYGGGGQGNHLPGAYATATRHALGSRYRSNALAQEKTGEIWVGQRMLGTNTRADFEHCDVALFLGKNPWHSHSIPRARVTLKAIAKDPNRTLIVIDPRRTETADLADIHLAVRPGTDAWLLAALLFVIVEEDLVDHAFINAHATGLDSVVATLRAVSFDACCERSGIEPATVRKAARVIAGARALSSFEDLGVQMNHHSTVVSYLHKLLVFLTGNLGKKGTHFVPTPLVPFLSGSSGRTSPVAGARIVSGLVPCNVIADEILADHPKRYRAMIVEAANPAHSLADTRHMCDALDALDLLVVIDVAMTETARRADYVLPAATQFEKAEASFFNFDFPANTFQLRPRLFAPPDGPLPEAEIHARIVEALGAVTTDDLAMLRDAAQGGRGALIEAFLSRVLPDARLAAQAAVLLYRTLDVPANVREGAVLLGLALRACLQNAPSFERAGFRGSPTEMAEALFAAMIAQPSGITFAVDDWNEVVGRIATPDGKIALSLPDLLDEVSRLAGSSAREGLRDTAFPFVLSAGERRSFTANTILRDPAWRKKDEHGALRVGLADAQSLHLATGDLVRLITHRSEAVVSVEVTDTMQPGHVSLPNGFGVTYPGADHTGDDGDADHTATDTGETNPTGVRGVAPNELTRVGDRDPFVGTPFHKHVRARIEPIVAEPD